MIENIPTFEADAFICPHCHAFSKQEWDCVQMWGSHEEEPVAYKDFNLSLCQRCHKPCLWFRDELVYPDAVYPVEPDEGMSDEIKEDFEEARSIVMKSPRGAAALLRLCMQKLCIELGEKGKDLNTDIGKLVKKGLREEVQESLDAVRVIGNEAVHPGELDLRDDIETAGMLFSLVNFIIDQMITQPKEIRTFFNTKLPKTKKKSIEARDRDAKAGGNQV